MSRRRNEATKAELRARVHPPESPDVRTLVRQALEQERRAEAEAQARAEAEQFVGGPCWACGCTSATAIDRDTEVLSSDWHSHVKGPECGTCADWRGGGTDEELLDKVAAILRYEPLTALVNPMRLRFRIEHGLAQKVGVVAWKDSGLPPGTRWGHLADTKTTLDAEVDRLSKRPVPTLAQILEATAHLPGRPIEQMPWNHGLDAAEEQKILDQRQYA